MAVSISDPSTLHSSGMGTAITTPDPIPRVRLVSTRKPCRVHACTCIHSVHYFVKHLASFIPISFAADVGDSTLSGA